MSDKKIIIAALILSVMVVGGGWYYSKYKPQSAAILQTPSPSQQPAISNIEGITIGNPNAPVTIEEYTNFMCSACARFATTALKSIEEDYIKTGKAKMVIYVFPPLELSKAALCSDEQNKFSEYHDYLFSHQGAISSEQDLTNFAVNVGMDGQKFQACYASDKYNGRVQTWLDAGKAKGVEATPTFFINGQNLVGAQPYDEFKKIIDQKLEGAK